MSLSGCGEEEVMTDPFSTSSIPVCLSLKEKEGKNQQTQGVYLKVGDSLHHLILIAGVILLAPRASSHVEVSQGLLHKSGHCRACTSLLFEV